MTSEMTEFPNVPLNRVHEVVLVWIERQDPTARHWLARVLSPVSLLAQDALERTHDADAVTLGLRFMAEIRAGTNREVDSFGPTEFQVTRSIGLAAQLSAHLTLVLSEGPDPAGPALHGKRWERMCEDWAHHAAKLAERLRHMYRGRAEH